MTRTPFSRSGAIRSVAEAAEKQAKAAAGEAWKSLKSFYPSGDDLLSNGLLSVDPDRLGGTARSTREAMDYLRTRTAQTLQEKGWRRIGVTAPVRGNGASFVAANLALSLGRLHDKRTILIDFDLAAPSLAQNFSLTGSTDLAAMLRGETDPTGSILRIGDSLSVAANSKPCSSPAEHLLADATTNSLTGIQTKLEPDFMLFDLPPVSDRDVFHAAIAHVDTVLLVVQSGKTRPSQLSFAEAEINSRCPLLGVALNEVR